MENNIFYSNEHKEYVRNIKGILIFKCAFCLENKNEKGDFIFDFEQALYIEDDSETRID